MPHVFKARLDGTWPSKWHPSAWKRGWNQMLFNVPSNPNYSTIVFYGCMNGQPVLPLPFILFITTAPLQGQKTFDSTIQRRVEVTLQPE